MPPVTLGGRDLKSKYGKQRIEILYVIAKVPSHELYSYSTHLQMVSLPERSVMWTKVSLNEAKMCATPNTSSPSLTLN